MRWIAVQRKKMGNFAIRWYFGAKSYKFKNKNKINDRNRENYVEKDSVSMDLARKCHQKSTQ